MNPLTLAKAGHARRQRGAALPIALVILLVMVFVGIAGMDQTLVEDRMTLNFRDRSLALNAADASLRAGETWLRDQLAKPTLVTTGACTTPPLCGSSDPFVVWEATSFSGSTSDWIGRDWAWWTTHGITYQGSTGQSSMGDVYQQPRSMIEFREFNASSDSGIASNLNAEKSMMGVGWHYYNVIGAGTGYRAETIAVTESTFKKWF